MKVQLTIEVELEHTCGKFASSEEVAEALCDELESCDPGTVYGVGADGESEYEVTSFQVQVKQ